MTQYFILFAFCAGLIAGAGPVRFYYEAKEDKRERMEADAKLLQEKKNVEIVTAYTDAIASIADHYRKHPVRVRIPGCEGSPGGSIADAGSITVIVGGIKRDNGAAIGE